MTTSGEWRAKEGRGSQTPRGRFRNGGRSYRDPAYRPIESALEQEYGLPPGLLARIRTRGERSNADQVSSAGARTVYQVIPETRRALLDRYGVDAWASPQDAARAAALHLRETHQRTGDWNRAVIEYHGGSNPRRWGRRTWDYWDRVMRR